MSETEQVIDAAVSELTDTIAQVVSVGAPRGPERLAWRLASVLHTLIDSEHIADDELLGLAYLASQINMPGATHPYGPARLQVVGDASGRLVHRIEYANSRRCDWVGPANEDCAAGVVWVAHHERDTRAPLDATMTRQCETLGEAVDWLLALSAEGAAS